MASLYIKDSETAGQVAELAALLGTTKTEAVRQAVGAYRANLQGNRPHAEAPPSDAKADAFIAWFDEYRRLNPLPPETGQKADKAFFDAMWDEL